MRHSTTFRVMASTATVRAAVTTNTTAESGVPHGGGGNEEEDGASRRSSHSSRYRDAQSDHVGKGGAHSSSSSRGSPQRGRREYGGRRGDGPSYTKGYSSSVPHHQSQGQAGGRAAAQLMQQKRNISPYSYHTVAPPSPALQSGGRGGSEIVAISSAHSAYAITGRRVEAAAVGLLQRGLSVVDEAPPPATGQAQAAYPLRVLDPPASSRAPRPADMRRMRYEPFDRLFHRYIERGFVSVPALVHHPEAPHPAILLDNILQHRTPCALLTEQTLLAVTYAHTRSHGYHHRHHNANSTPVSASSSSVANMFALQRVAATLKQSCEHLYVRQSVQVLLAEALLHEGLYNEVCVVMQDMPDEFISPSLWAALVDAAAQSKLADSQLLWRLLSVKEGMDGLSDSGADGAGSFLTASGQVTAAASLPDNTGPHLQPSPSAVPVSPFAVHSSAVVLLPPRSPAAAATSGQVHDGAGGGPGKSDGTISLPPSDHWVRLASAEIGYAAEHYCGLNSAIADDRGGGSTSKGQLRLHPSTHAYLGDATASLMYDKARKKAASEDSRLPASGDGGGDTVDKAQSEAQREDGMGGEEVVSSFPGDDALQQQRAASGDQARQPRGDSSSSTAISSDELLLLERAAPAMVLGASGVVFGLDARITAQLMLRVGVSFGGQASPLLALHMLRRYLDSCHALRAEADVLQARVAAELARLEKTVNRQDFPLRRELASGRESTARNRPQERQRVADTIRLLKQQAETALQGATPHPSPFLVFFKILREARDFVAHNPNAPTASPLADGSEEPQGSDGSGAGPSPQSSSSSLSLPLVHWELAWAYFQLLNRENPLWYVQIPEEASDLCFYVLEMLCRGSSPWMSLNVARAASARHIVDGLDMSLWLLHHLDPSHHTEEAKDVTRKVFRWLLVDVGIHLQDRLHHHLIPVTRVLLRLGLQDELKVLYNAVLDNVFAFSEDFRESFIQVMADLVCPACASILSETDVYAERVCGNCMTVVPPKDPAMIPSFQLTAEHVQKLRERRKAQRAKSRQRVYGTVGRLAAGGADAAASPAAALVYNKIHKLQHRTPFDAAELFRQKILNVEAAPLLPGVSVSSEFALFPVAGTDGEDGDGGGGAVLDVRAAMEESSRRLALQRAARQYALAQRGARGGHEDGSLYGSAQAALPSSSTSFAAFAGERAGRGEAHALPPSTRMDGPWTCVWCQEKNSAWSSRLQCSACGAETGPAAPWRQFAYAQDDDVMGEVRARIANAEDRPIDAVVAAYLLMLYRRTFLLKAVPHDQERIRQLVEKLCLLHERVLAAYVYTRFVPPPARRKDNNLLLLAQLFGGGSSEAFQSLTRADLKNDEVLFKAVFTAATCKVCFGAHDWRVCPIITRDFASAKQRPSINLSPEEKQKAILEHLQRMVAHALAHGRENSKVVVDAYASFVTSPFRELFAEVHASETNELSILLSEFKQYRRAAFVLCHVPLHARKNAAYLALCGYFSVTQDEAMQLLAKRSPMTVVDDSHPNFVQVTMTCCMCLDQRHASFNCPRLHAWLAEAKKLATAAAARPASSRHQLLDVPKEQQTLRRLKAQVDGWTSAGPERLHAFYRFLLEQVDTLRPSHHQDGLFGTLKSSGSSKEKEEESQPVYRASPSDPLVYALNKTTTKLASVQKRSYAYRLYARAPPELISQATTTAMLRLNRFSEDGIRALLNATAPATSSSSSFSAASLPAARAAALPLKHRCLLCFHHGHSFFDCPELAAQATLADKLTYVLQQVGGINATADGISAAAAYVYHTYNKGLLSNELLRSHPALVKAMLVVAQRCFAVKELAAGVRVLRRIPVEMVPPEAIYVSLWRAAGLPEDAVEARRLELLALYDSEGLQPSIESPPPRKTYSARFMSDLGHALHDDLCRHCYAHGHTLATCGVFHQEVGFGRDYVASYRMSMMSEQLTADWQDAYLLKLVDFFAAHQYFMPYHIAGVANALNAIAAMWSFRGEPGIALAHLLRIPPAYRRRQAFKHILHCLQIPTAEISRVLASFYFSPDDAHAPGSSGGGGGQQSQQVVAQHLLLPKPAIRDVAMEKVFAHFPAAIAALEQSEQRMERIRQRNRVPAAATPTSFSSSSTSEMKALLAEKVTGDAGSVGGKDGDVGESAVGGSASAAASKPVSSSARTSVATIPAMQSGDITRLREDYDPILTELEDAVGMKLGSRHVLFTSAVDVVASSSSSIGSKDGGEAPMGSSSASSTSAAAAAAAASSPLAAAFAAAAAAAKASAKTTPAAPAAPAATAAAAEEGAAQEARAGPRVAEADIVREVFHSGSGQPTPQAQKPPSPPQQQPQQQNRTRGNHKGSGNRSNRRGGGWRNSSGGGSNANWDRGNGRGGQQGNTQRSRSPPHGDGGGGGGAGGQNRDWSRDNRHRH